MSRTETDARTRMIRRVLEAAARDPRIVGAVDYGSSSEGRADALSDVDLALFLRDADFEEFEREWMAWAAQFGTLLLAYVGGVGHPWAVYDEPDAPLPLRVDFAFHRESKMEIMLTWPNSPVSAAAMVLYDATNGKLTAQAAQLVGKSLAPPDAAVVFERLGGDFWYYMLRTLTRLKRGQLWGARYDFDSILLGNLHALLRMETDALERWLASTSAAGIEQVITPERLKQLDACIAGREASQLVAAFRKAALLGYEVCEAIARRHGWAWPQALAARTLELLADAERTYERGA